MVFEKLTNNNILYINKKVLFFNTIHTLCHIIVLYLPQTTFNLDFIIEDGEIKKMYFINIKKSFIKLITT